jgi:phosphatidylglycerophosphatase A
MPVVIERSLALRVLREPVHWIPFGFGAGLLPLAPGTWGSAVAVLAYWLTPPLTLLQNLGIVVGGFVLGMWLCGLSSRRLGVHDHPGIVFDEIVAMWATLAVVPRQWHWTLFAFVMFRVMDVWKPWPIREADHRIGGGLGIMLDDVLAAVLAAVMLIILRSVAAFLT